MIGVAAKFSLSLDPWQQEILRDSLSRDAVTGRWLSPRVVASVPRQNGKGAIIEALELAFLLGLLGDGSLMVHSAHEFKTSQDAFRRIKGFFENDSRLAGLVESGKAKIATAVARESITVGPRTLKFFARSKGSGRGFSADFLILDEAQELPDEAWSAMLPTISARANPQIWMFGTPPDPTMNGAVFTRQRESALSGEDERLAYFEWSAHSDDDPAELSTWQRANPAMTGPRARPEEETVRDEYFGMTEESFGRERLGMWDGVASLSVIPEDAWAALVSEALPTGRVAFAVDVSPDRSKASIGVAGKLDDGRVFVQVIDNRKGTGWIVPRLGELTAKWNTLAVVVDSGGPAAALVEEMRQARIRRLRILSTDDVRRSCASFYDMAVGSPGGVSEYDGSEIPARAPWLAHPDQPGLNDALANARKRALGEGWAWDRRDPNTDITPLVAVTFAAYAVASKPAKATPQRVIVL